MSDPLRFTLQDWQNAEARIRAGAHERRLFGDFDLESFKDWLSWDETQQRLQDHFGETWTLDQALDLCLGVVPLDRYSVGSFNDTTIKRRNDQTKPDDADDDEDGAELDAVGSAITSEEFQKRAEAKVKEYLEHYTGATPNDLASLRDLASAEVMMDVLNQLMADALSDPMAISRYSRALKEVSERARALQRMMGIDRAARERAAKEASEADQALEIIGAAGAWAEENAIPLKHCGILYALVLSDFREIPFTVTWTCPHCGGKAEHEHIPTAEDLRAVEPDWVAGEEGETRAKEVAETQAQFLADQVDEEAEE